MKKLALLGLVFSGFLFASEAAEAAHHTDIIPRTVNFVIFVAILYYLTWDKIVTFFKNRRESIAKKFQEIENKLKESKERKEALRKELENARLKAKEIVENAKAEAKLLEEKINTQTEEEIKLLQKQFEEFKKVETNRVKKEAVREFLEEVLKDVKLSSEDAAKLILKVA